MCSPRDGVDAVRVLIPDRDGIDRARLDAAALAVDSLFRWREGWTTLGDALHTADLPTWAAAVVVGGLFQTMTRCQLARLVLVALELLPQTAPATLRLVRHCTGRQQQAEYPSVDDRQSGNDGGTP